MRHWLMKSEPDAYAWAKLVEDGRGTWDGVRNHQASNNMKAMKAGDRVFFYHSTEGREIVGVMEIAREYQPDTSDATGRWGMVEVKPLYPLKRPVTLAAIKADRRLAKMWLVRHSRLSVMPVTAAEWRIICRMGGVVA